MSSPAIQPTDLLDFWLDLPEEAYFTKDAEFDVRLTERFGAALNSAKLGEYDHWADTVEGALALVILLDQFSRNIHRGSPEMFAGDEKALGIARAALERGDGEVLPFECLQWLVMPFMHSEKLKDQKHCVALCKKFSLDDTTPYAVDHADIIRRFGRFPHRNELLNRSTTKEEKAFLDEGGFAG